MPRVAAQLYRGPNTGSREERMGAIYTVSLRGGLLDRLLDKRFL